MAKTGLLNQIKQLRQETGAGVMDARRALQQADGNMKKAKSWLDRNAVVKARKKTDRQTADGALFAYVHQTGKVAALVKLGCETDFVAKTLDFQQLGKEIAMQVASMNPKDEDELMKQDWIREPDKTIKQLVEEHVAKLGESIKILEIVRMKI